MAQPQQASGPPRLSSRCTRNRERPAAPRQKWLAGARCAPNVRTPNARLTLIPWFSTPGTIKPTSTSNYPIGSACRPSADRHAVRTRRPRTTTSHALAGSPRGRRVGISAATGEPDAPGDAMDLFLCFKSPPCGYLTYRCVSGTATKFSTPILQRERGVPAGGQCRGLQGQLPGLGLTALRLRVRVGLS